MHERIPPRPDEESLHGEATELLARAAEGDRAAGDRLYELLQGELRVIARSQLSSYASDHTLQPTALVNECWLRLARSSGAQAHNRTQFLALAARAMRTALIDHARRKRALKRQGGGKRVKLEQGVLDGALDRTLDLCSQRGFDPIDLDDALERLAHEEPRQAKLIELRFFGGLSRQEAANALGISLATVAREWELARHRLIWDLGLAEE